MTSGKQASNNYPPSFNRINDFLVIPSYIRLPWYLQNLIMLVCSVAYTKYRSSHPEVFCEKGVLINFAKFTGKHLCQSLFFNKVAGACICVSKAAICRCFTAFWENFVKLLGKQI